jgi:hypothetical protein
MMIFLNKKYFTQENYSCPLISFLLLLKSLEKQEPEGVPAGKVAKGK